MSASKVATRKQISTVLRALTPAQIATQSAAVMAHLAGLPAYMSCMSASIYLPMDKGCEVDTWPIIADLLARGAHVAIPRVTGPSPSDLVMLRLSSLEQAQALPRTKWGIPEPDDVLAAQMEDATSDPTITLLLVPGVAFDSRCGRLGHGRGYYDSFIHHQRLLMRKDGEEVLVVGLGLSPQLIDTVPMGQHDERLDYVIVPEGRLAYTSASDLAHATALGDSSRKRERHEHEGRAGAAGSSEGASGTLDLHDRVNLATGRWKYACLRLSRGHEAPFIAVRSARGEYHATVAEPAIEAYEAMGYACEPLGGGRIVRDDTAKTIHLYGYSVGFGGAEGGPPGRGMRDHAEVAHLIERSLPAYSVTWDRNGY